MITENELLDAIDKCKRDPITYNSCEKLANYYIIYDHLFGGEIRKKEYPIGKTTEKIISTNGGSDFLIAVNGKASDKIWSIMDELLSVIRDINPRLYDAVMRKIED